MRYLNYGMIPESRDRISDKIMPKRKRRDVIVAPPD